MWLDPWLVEIKAKTTDEDRFLLIGILDGKCYSAVVTYRNGATRIISARRSRGEEVLFYESR